jgi:HAMP domain-containing protein
MAKRFAATAATTATAAFLVLAFAADALACVCVEGPLRDRLDDADAAAVGRIVAEEAGEVEGAPQSFLTFEVDQRVKGDLDKTIVVRSPSGTSCDLRVRTDEVVGLLLTTAPDGAWLASLCSIVDPGELTVVGGEPRGGPIKVAIGVVILGLVLLLALVRLRRGSRPQLPGPPPPGGRTPRV